MLLQHHANRDDVLRTPKEFPQLGAVLSEDDLLDEINIVRTVRRSDTSDTYLSRRSDILRVAETTNRDMTKTKHILAFSTCIAGSSSQIERIFSMINNIWTDQSGKSNHFKND